MVVCGWTLLLSESGQAALDVQVKRQSMSKNQFIWYRGNDFCAYDVAVGVFLKHLIDRAEQYLLRHDSRWLRECIDRWRVNAVINEYGVHLDEAWSEEQRGIIRMLIDEACGVLGERPVIASQEVESWEILDQGGAKLGIF